VTNGDGEADGWNSCSVGGTRLVRGRSARDRGRRARGECQLRVRGPERGTCFSSMSPEPSSRSFSPEGLAPSLTMRAHGSYCMSTRLSTPVLKSLQNGAAISASLWYSCRSVRDSLRAGRWWDGRGLRARDTKLNRDVALKILPSKFADDDDRLARFRQEAQVLRGGLQLGLARQAGTQLIRSSMQRGDAAPAHFAYVTAPLA
jgi:hypothetical protein